MAAQDEREPGVVVMSSVVGSPMVQDIPEQDIVMEEEEQFFPPQMDSEPEMGTAAYDTSPSLLRNPPPIPAETAQLSASDIVQICAMLAGISGDIHRMKTQME